MASQGQYQPVNQQAQYPFPSPRADMQDQHDLGMQQAQYHPMSGMGNPNEKKDNINISYQGINTPGGTPPEMEPFQPSINMMNHPQMARKRTWLTTIVMQIGCLLWLVPIVYLLIVNFRGHIIGASAWCPGGNCFVDVFNSDTMIPQLNMLKFDKHDHNLLGVLQLVAKALEVWFCFIAGALVYIVTMILAGKKEGLPIGYITRPNEFDDVMGLFDPLMWTSVPPAVGPKTKKFRRSRYRIYAFIFMTVVLCVICNLMGPATAVLVIPTLQWLDTDKVGNDTFASFNTASVPSGDGFVYQDTVGCYSEDFIDGNYSCTADPWAPTLDALLDQYLASGYGTSQQDSIQFSFNSTQYTTADNNTDTVWWAPNRQLLKELNLDLGMTAAIAEGYNATGTGYPELYDSYLPYNNTLRTFIEREGPVVGTEVNMWLGYNDTAFWQTDLSWNKSIRCYANYDLQYTPASRQTSHGNYTKCLRVGGGWSPNNTNSARQFTAYGPYNHDDDTFGWNIAVNVFTADRAVFLENGTFPVWLPEACLVNGNLSARASSTCDWDRLFTLDPTSPLFNRSTYVNTIDFVISDNSTQTNNARFAVDFATFWNFTTYSLDSSPFTNPLFLVQTNNLPTTGSPLDIDPAWYMAAWSVDDDGYLPANRSSSIFMNKVMNDLWNNPTDGLNKLDPNSDPPDYDYSPDYLALLPIGQTLSVLEFNTTKHQAPPKTEDPLHPLLARSGRIYVWAYGLSSRTGELGAVVAIMGAAVTIVQFFLGLVNRTRYRSPTQLLVAALEHKPTGEFAEASHDEKQMARVRFHVRDELNNAYKLSFYRPER